MKRMIELGVIMLLALLRVMHGYRILETDPKYGVNIEVMDDPLFYNTFVPIIYEFQLPQWKASDLKVKWPSGNSNQCDRSDAWHWSWDRQACPVVYHCNALIDSLLRNMSDVWKGNTFAEKNNLFSNWQSDQIVPHFKGSSLTETELNDYVKYFGQSSFAKAIVTKNISAKKDINVDVYERMLANFRGKSVIGIASEGSQNINSPILYIQYAILTNSYTAIQAMQILNFYMVRNEWADAVASCKNQKIPQNLVTKGMLLKSLGQIRKQLSEYHKIKYRLSIHPEELSSYYHLQLTDCTFTTTNKFIVRILVPIRKMGSEEILVKINTIPFIKQEAGRTEICQIANVEGEYIASDDKISMIQVDYCYLNDICKIPDRSQWFLPHSCLSAIIAKNETEINELCFMDCRIYSESNGPYFKKIATDKYAIAGSLSETGEDAFIFLSCTKNSHMMINGEHFGAVIATLPCDCVLIYELDVLTVTGQCNNKTMLFDNSFNLHIIPYLWEQQEEDEDEFEIIDPEPTDFVEIIDISSFTIPPPTLSTTEAAATDNSSIDYSEEHFVERFEPLNTSTDQKISHLVLAVNRLTSFVVITLVLIAILSFSTIYHCIKLKMLRLEITRNRISEIQHTRNFDPEKGISEAVSIQNNINEPTNVADTPRGVTQQIYPTLSEALATLND